MRFTIHAVERYIERCRPGATPPVALMELRSLAVGLRPAGKTPLGDRILIGQSGLRFVVKPSNVGEMCVTVLAPSDGRDVDVPSVCETDPLVKAQSDALRHLRALGSRGDRKAAAICEAWLAAMEGS